MLNVVELIADPDECAFDQVCAFGHRVEHHAVYCQNDDWKAGPRKCRRTWYTGGETRDTDCPGFKPNDNPNARKETISRDDAMATLYDEAIEDDAFISNLAPHKRAEWNAYNRGEGSFTYPHEDGDYLVPPPPPTEAEREAFREMMDFVSALAQPFGGSSKRVSKSRKRPRL